jgi:outer membrane protein assembly factor BamB
MFRILWSVLSAVGIFSALVATAAEPGPAKGNWAQWRGPTGQGYADDARVPLTWGDNQNLLWKTELPGRGNSTPVIWGERIFLTSSSSDGNERHVLCLRATDGKLLWQQTASKGVSPGKTHAWNGYASSSCVTDGTHVYAFFGTPGLFCYDLDGQLVWKHSFGILTASTGWGTAASPFLFEDLIIQNCDNSGAAALPAGTKPEEAAPKALVALDKKTGKVRWQTERTQGIGWSTPLLIPSPDGRIDLVLNGPHGVWGYEPRTGKEIWHCERHRGMDQALFGEAMPVFDRDKLIMLSGRHGPMMAVRLGGSGDVTKSHVLWDVMRKTQRDVGSPILWNDLVYVGDRTGYLSCHDAKTGELLSKERIGSKSFSASPVAVQDRLLFVMEDGLTAVVEPGRALKIAARNTLTDPGDFRASPAIANGRLYLRSQSNLYCIGSK